MFLAVMIGVVVLSQSGIGGVIYIGRSGAMMKVVVPLFQRACSAFFVDFFFSEKFLRLE